MSFADVTAMLGWIDGWYTYVLWVFVFLFVGAAFYVATRMGGMLGKARALAERTRTVSLPVIANCGQCSFMKREELPQGIPYREGEKRILRLLCSHPSTEIAGSVTPWGITLEGFDEAREKDFRPPGSKIVPPKGCPLRRDVEVVS